MVLPETAEKGSFYEAERIRSAIYQTQFFDQDLFQLKQQSNKRKQTFQNVTVSIGIAALQGDIGKEEFLKCVESSLSKAKASGRNTTVRYSQVVDNL